MIQRQFRVPLGDTVVWVDLLLAGEQTYLYIGDAERRMDNLQLLLQAPVQEEPLRRTLQENAPVSDELKGIAESIGLALARRTKGPVFYAYNLSVTDPRELLMLMGGLKKAVLEQMGDLRPI